MSKYTNIIGKFKGKRLLVLGDLVLDRYIKGNVSRISPEAPVPIVLQEESFFTPGGAANVANNLSSLGADVSVVGKIGDDIEGAILKKELQRRRIHTQGVFIDKSMDTIFKTRIIAQHQQVVRVDRESKASSGPDTVKKDKIFPFLRRHFNTFQAVVISDYGKGMIDMDLVGQVHELAAKYKIPVVVDPKLEDLRAYGQVSCITPNKKEAENAIRNIKICHPDTRKLGLTSDRLSTDGEIEKAGKELLTFLNLESLLITLGEQGMYLFEKGKGPVNIPTRAKEVFDVTGAGDTVISVFTLCLTAGATKFQAADLANHAAGIVVGKMGTATVTREELIASIKDH